MKDWLPLIIVLTTAYLMCAFIQFGYRFNTHGDPLWTSLSKAFIWPRGLKRWLNSQTN